MKMQLKQAHLEMHQYKWQHAKGQGSKLNWDNADNRLYFGVVFWIS